MVTGGVCGEASTDGDNSHHSEWCCKCHNDGGVATVFELR